MPPRPTPTRRRGRRRSCTRSTSSCALGRAAGEADLDAEPLCHVVASVMSSRPLAIWRRDRHDRRRRAYGQTPGRLLACPMQVCIFPDAASVAVAAADRIREVVREKPDALAGAADGQHADRGVRGAGAHGSRRATIFSRGVWAYAIDEFAGVPRDTPGTNAPSFAQHLRVPLRALHMPEPGRRGPGAAHRARSPMRSGARAASTSAC